MELYLKQKVFSWSDKFYVYDQAGNEKYYVEGEMFSFGKKLHLYDMADRELAFIWQKILAFMPKYYVEKDGATVAEVVKEFTFFTSEYTVNGPQWKVTGNFWDHEYSINSANGAPVASVSKEWFTWGDTYKINVFPGGDEITALAVVLIIDACIEASQN